MSPAEAAIREWLPKFEQWMAAGFPIDDPHDTYPADLYSAAVQPSAMRSLLSELDALRARCEAGEALLRRCCPRSGLLRHDINAHLNQGAGRE